MIDPPKGPFEEVPREENTGTVKWVHRGALPHAGGVDLMERKIKRYPGIGHCIYCGNVAEETNEGKLEDEHIFPFGLCGNLIFQDASCRICATYINKNIESFLLRETFGIVRTKLNTWTRNRKDRKFFFECEVNISGRPQVVSFPAEEYPSFNIVYQANPPGLLEGKTKTPTGYERVRVWFANLSSARPFRGEIRQAWKAGQIDKFMAKIAHGYVTAEKLIDGFEPLLPAVILGEDPHIFDYVGSTDITPHEFAERYQTGSNFNEIRTFTKEVNGQEFLIALVQIFSLHLGPIYQVVAGRRSLTASASIGSDKTARTHDL